MSFVEINLFGVYVAPIVPMLAVAWLVFLLLRRMLFQRGLLRGVWHPALFDVSLYVIVLAAIVLAVAIGGAYV